VFRHHSYGELGQENIAARGVWWTRRKGTSIRDAASWASKGLVYGSDWTAKALV
jgi:hypothetical protein